MKQHMLDVCKGGAYKFGREKNVVIPVEVSRKEGIKGKW